MSKFLTLHSRPPNFEFHVFVSQIGALLVQMPEKVNRFVISFALASVLGHLVGLKGRITGVWRHFQRIFFFFFLFAMETDLIVYRPISTIFRDQLKSWRSKRLRDEWKHWNDNELMIHFIAVCIEFSAYTEKCKFSWTVNHLHQVADDRSSCSRKLALCLAKAVRAQALNRT